MKKKLLIVTGLFSLSIGMFAFIGLNNQDASVVSAEETKELYIQVKDTLELNYGDTVLISSYDHAVGGIGGNPCFTYARILPGGNNDKTKFYFSDSEAIKFTVCPGFNGYSSYAFKSTRKSSEEKEAWLKTADKYLSYADKITIDGHDYGYHEDGITIQTKGDIIFKSALDEYTSWNLDFDEDGFVYMTRYYEENRYGLVDDPICIQHLNAYTTNGYFHYGFGGSDLRIFRKIDISDHTKFDYYIPHKGNKTHYEPNEDGILDGLEMEVTYLVDHTTFPVIYNNETSYFSIGKADYDTQSLPFTWLGIPFSVAVKVDVEMTDEHYYYSLHHLSQINDLRGTYLLGVDDGSSTSVLNLSSIATSESSANVPHVTSLDSQMDEICDKNDLNQYISEVVDNVFEIVYDEDGFYIKVGTQYLCKKDSGHSYYRLYLGNRENAFQVKLGLNGNLLTTDNDVFVYFVPSGAQGVYLNKNNESGMNEERMVLYKKELCNEETDEIETFRASFFTHTSACRDDESTVLENLGWNTLSNEFNNLSWDSQGYIACLTYIHNTEESESLNDMVDRYDYIVKKYSMNNFMHRNGDLINDLQGGTSLTNNIKSISNNYIAIIIISISMISLSVVGAIFLFKKKKHI